MNWFLVGIGLYTVLACLTNIFVFGKYRKALYLLIPVQLFLCFSFYVAVDHIKGFATHSVDELVGKQFTFITYYVRNNEIYLIAVPPGGFEPRMYIYFSAKKGTPDELSKLGKKLDKLSLAKKEREKGRSVIIEDSPYDNDHFQIIGMKKLPEKQPDE